MQLCDYDLMHPLMRAGAVLARMGTILGTVKFAAAAMIFLTRGSDG